MQKTLYHQTFLIIYRSNPKISIPYSDSSNFSELRPRNKIKEKAPSFMQIIGNTRNTYSIMQGLIWRGKRMGKEQIIYTIQSSYAQAKKKKLF
jgi:hypothetical protein